MSKLFDFNLMDRIFIILLFIIIIYFFCIWLENYFDTEIIKDIVDNWILYWEKSEERSKMIEEIIEESPYLRGYHAYWEGLESNEVSALQYQGWCDARDEVEKLPVEQVSQR